MIRLLPFAGVEEPAAEKAGAGVSTPTDGGIGPEPPKPVVEPPPAKLLPKRFFATLAIDLDMAGLKVAHTMDGFLVELTRTKGPGLRVTLELERSSA
ncbi:MAG: hypothetical protein OXM58_05495 [Rhodospirillaceae bacterium]|nr:hypothetical protein [Rhodospirillaceae bacterium]MDE0617509.1 hypothetical protein [Rhodospirillaceae bacterium]